MNNLTHCTIDIETRGKYDSCIITRIAITPFRFDEGIVPYDDLVNRSLYISLNQEEQRLAGRTEEKDTMDWWNSQPDHVREESLNENPNDLSVVEAFNKIKNFLKRWNYNHFESLLFSRNSGFESFKIQSLNEQFLPGTKQVLNNWKWHELKSFNLILSGGETEKFIPPDFKELNFDAHNAQHDAAMDTYRLLHLWHQVF
jgi:hypothetical protein